MTSRYMVKVNSLHWLLGDESTEHSQHMQVHKVQTQVYHSNTITKGSSVALHKPYGGQGYKLSLRTSKAGLLL